MYRKMTSMLIVSALIASFATMNGVSFAEEQSTEEQTVKELREQIEMLKNRVEELEQQNQRPPQEDSWELYNRRQQQWDPFAEMDRMQAEMNRMFESAFSNRSGSNGGMFSSSMGYNYDIDMKETDDGYVITFDMHGLDQDKIDIQVNTSSITIKGQHSNEETGQGPNQFFQAQTFGSFMQTIPLPTDANTAKIKTEKKGDSLVITMPKKST